MATYVPSPEEIKRLVANAGATHGAVVRTPEEEFRLDQKNIYTAKAKAQEAATKSLAAVQKTHLLEKKIDNLEKSLAARGRQTPHELRAALNELFDRYDFSPAEELVRMLKDENYDFHVKDLNLRKQILCELQQYVMPKLKSTEIKGEVEHTHTINIVRYGEDGAVKVEAPRKSREIIDISPIKPEVERG